MNTNSILTVDKLSKKFSTSFRRSLWYGVQDIAKDLNPYQRQATNQTGHLRKTEFWGLQNISFSLHRGESLAIIGDNGAGKSTLLKLLNGLIKPDGGQIRIRGQVGALIELGIGLDPVLSGRENIYVRAALLGLSRRQVDALIEQIIDFTGLGDAIHMPVQFYSSGMTARLAYAVAAHLNPDILLVDEVLAVGDLDFQRKCLKHMQSYLTAGGSIVLVSHVPYHIQAVCQRGLLLEKGTIKFAGTASETLDRYFAQQYQQAMTIEQRDQASLSPDRPMVIRHLTIQPTQSAALVAIQSGSDVRVRLSYESMTVHDNMGWAFFIWTGDGATCITGGISTAPVTLKAGEHSLTCRLPRLPLTAGAYQVKAAVFGFDSLQVLAHLGWENAPVRLLVEEDVSTLKNLQSMAQQLITIDVEWTHEA
ncbi:ATP-binding cassette domain-containing protein [Spirosoma agri]|uniref:ATP-binding cassette domain-containing protein n=1 Tax=Spirosoma agri TaxID=1987381 RepID=A0A6M0IQ48_9BACT|nr:ABC transporter ATP-binding protein [Spirosoma agri]NEU70037.1 ATP-binding cassette domain-containing protein [Spirosoma agri]